MVTANIFVERLRKRPRARETRAAVVELGWPVTRDVGRAVFYLASLISATSARAGRGSILTLKNVPNFTPLKNCRTAGVLDHEGRSTAAARRGLFALYRSTSGRIVRCHRPRTAAAGAVQLFPEIRGFAHAQVPKAARKSISTQ